MADNKTILFINRRMGFARGGGEYVDLALAQALANRNYRPHFIIGTDLSGRSLLPFTEFPVTYAKSPYLVDLWQQFPFPLSVLINLLDIWLFERSATRAVAAYMRRDPNTVAAIEILGMPQLAYSLQRRYPHVSVITRFPGPLGRLFNIGTTKRLHNLFAPGDAYRNVVQINPQTIHIPNGVDRKQFYPDTTAATKLRKRYGIAKDTKILVTIARLVPLKNHSYTLATLARLRKQRQDFHFLIVGDGPLRSVLEGQVDQLGIREYVTFVGATKKEETALYYQGADAFLLSSSYENFPNVIIEAFASGLPAIATKVGGIPLIIEDTVNGLLVDLDNPQQYREKIATLLDNASLRRSMGKAAEKTAAQYSWDEVADTYIATYLSSAQ